MKGRRRSIVGLSHYQPNTTSILLSAKQKTLTLCFFSCFVLACRLLSAFSSPPPPPTSATIELTSVTPIVIAVMLAAPVSPTMPQLEAVPAAASTSLMHVPVADQPPALELYDSLSDADEEEDEDDDDVEDDDDSSDAQSAADVIADGAVPADGKAADGTGNGGEDEGEDDEDEEDEVPEPCPRFYLDLKRFGPYVNYNSLLRRHKQLTDTSKPQLPQSASTPSDPPTASSTVPTTVAAAAAAAAEANDTAMAVDMTTASTAADGDGDVEIVGEGKRRRKRQSEQDEYDTNDPFIDDTELPQEREEDDMRTEIEGFHVQIGSVQVKEREVTVKQEQGAGADEQRRKRQRKEWTKRQIPMSAAMSAQLDNIVKECQLLGGSDALGGSHRRLPDELVELLVQLNDIYEKDSSAWDATERKVLKYNMLERLETAMGQTRQAIKSRMKTAVQRHRREGLDSTIRTLKQSLQRAASHDYSDFHHRINTTPAPAATAGNVVVHKSADGRTVERYEYRPRFSLWMEELLALAAAVVEASGAKQGEDGRAVEAEGWQVEKELWEEVAGWWDAGVMTTKLIGERVKQARKDRRKRKKALQKQPSGNATSTTSSTNRSALQAAAIAAAAAGSEKSKAGKDGKHKADSGTSKHKDTEKRKKDSSSGAATGKDKTKKKAATDGKEAAVGSSSVADSAAAAHKHKSASAKPQKDGSSKEKDKAHKRSASLSSSAATTTTSSSTASPLSQPVMSSVFYEPPVGAGRWSDIHFPPAQINVVAKQSTSSKPATSTSSSISTQLTQP